MFGERIAERCAQHTRPFEIAGLDCVDRTYSRPQAYAAFRAFVRIYRCFTSVEADRTHRAERYALAAANTTQLVNITVGFRVGGLRFRRTGHRSQSPHRRKYDPRFRRFAEKIAP